MIREILKLVENPENVNINQCHFSIIKKALPPFFFRGKNKYIKFYGKQAMKI